MKTSALLVAASIFGSWSGVGLAQTTTALNAEATTMNTLASSQGDSKVVDSSIVSASGKLGASYYGNALSKSNIVTGSGHSASDGAGSAGGNGSGHGKGRNK